MTYVKPPSNKNDVKRAGREVAEDRASDESIAIIDQWRAAHGYVINTFQAWIKGHISKKGVSVEFAQRLKRKRTVIDKLKRKWPDGRPLIRDVLSMQDFAGCRMIFDSVHDLQNFREYIHSQEVMRNVEHKLRNEKDRDKYNYINNPKATGYRGIHDVYKHFPRGHRRGVDKLGDWDGLMVEIQYRTRAQHAWATAVEISDIIDRESTKFDLQETARGEFFAIASEVIARRHENIARAFPGIETTELENRMKILDKKMGISQRLSVLKQSEAEDKLKQHNVLNIVNKENGELALEVLSFKTAALAIQKSTELENDPSSINAVYVRSDNPKQLRSAYRNYFYDPVDFVKLIG